MSTCLDCGRPLDKDARANRLMGAAVMCRFHLEQYFGKPLKELITEKQAFDAKVEAGELICDVCGKPGARPVPGEGQHLCKTCNYRQGITRWS